MQFRRLDPLAYDPGGGHLHPYPIQVDSPNLDPGRLARKIRHARRDAEDRGVGWTADQVAEWTPPSKEAQIGYYGAVKAAAVAYIESLTEADLEKTMVIPPVAEPRSVAMLLGQFTWDNIAHGGQIAYLRGLFIGMGWHR